MSETREEAEGMTANPGPEKLSAQALAAIPEIVAFLRADAATRRGKIVKDGLWTAALILEEQLPGKETRNA